MSHKEKFRMLNLYYFLKNPRNIDKQLGCMTLVTSWRENSVCNCLHIREIQNYFKTVEAEVRQIQVKNEVQLLRGTSKKKKKIYQMNWLLLLLFPPLLSLSRKSQPLGGCTLTKHLLL